MVKWRNKSIDKLSKAELQYALQDAVEALTINQKTLEEDSLYKGLFLGLLAGSVASALTIWLLTII